MAVRYLLDTNIYIYIRRNRPTQVLERFSRLEPGEAAISVITYGELLYGAEKSAHRSRALETLTRAVAHTPVLPLPEDAGPVYGQIRANLQANGELIGANDMWIAAHAQAAKLILVTNNEREFRRIPSLQIQNWATGT
jgi:tRNA(fMet)-specific endonuclease VapC